MSPHSRTFRSRHAIVTVLFASTSSTPGLDTDANGLLVPDAPETPFSLTLIFTAVAVVMSETASNTASANMIVPVAIAVSQAAGVNPIAPALGATLGASMGFMMPISTPPNAIVYSSGHVPITQMMRHGIVLDIVGFIVIVAFVSALAWLF